MPRRNSSPVLEVDWHDAGADLTEKDRQEILRHLPRLAKAARDFPAGRVHVEVDFNPRKGGYGVSLNLPLPARSLYAAEWSRDLGAAARSAVNKVASQVASYRALLRRHERRSHRREIRPPAPAVQAPGAATEREFSVLHGLASRIARLVRHEIVHDPSLSGVAKEAISVPDVVDEALVWTMANQGKRPPYLSPEQYLWRRVLHQLDAAKESVLRRYSAEQEEARLADAHREPNPEVDMEWADAEDLIFGGGEPLPLDLDEASPAGSDPGEILDREALQEAVSGALRELPEAQRRTLLLHDLEGYDPEEIAFVLARSEDRVQEDLEGARRTLRRKLREFA